MPTVLHPLGVRIQLDVPWGMDTLEMVQFQFCLWNIKSLVLSLSTHYSSSGNLHLNIIGETHSEELLNLIEPYVFDWTGMYTVTI